MAESSNERIISSKSDGDDSDSSSSTAKPSESLVKSSTNISTSDEKEDHHMAKVSFTDSSLDIENQKMNHTYQPATGAAFSRPGFVRGADSEYFGKAVETDPNSFPRPCFVKGADSQYFKKQSVDGDSEENDTHKNKDETPCPSMARRLIAEIIGTFTLVFFGCGSVCALVYTEALVGVGQATTIWTLGASLAIYSAGSISGGHLNPAVSLAFAVVRPKNFSMRHLLPYWFAQLFGAFLAGGLNYGLFFVAIAQYEKKLGIVRGQDSILSAVGFGTYWSTSVSGGPHAMLIEMFGTAMLTFAIFAATNKKNNVPAAAVPALVGVAIGSIIAIIGSLSGGAINPARDLGPRLITAMAGWGKDSFVGVWVYMLGPFLGGPLGALLADNMF
eukprot:CAMPEP_0172520326 /NCGR_PEP_ID=MMETSP1066-20121228/291934_1 /TAXON_ID=671091 /ORGANISM="Coscinodiscus wailesii, Strain CCMP2513" /LENGTH=387 /DNA_ID=CAMNT_0013303067 /DNA_START=122 /DNA_END=1285 /DNA_ORIENTATION=-